MATSKITNSGIGDINTLVVDTTGIVYSGGNVGIGVSSPSGKLHLSESGATNQAATIFSLDGYHSTFGANLAKSSGTYTTPASSLSGGAWEYQPVNSLNNHGVMIYLSAPDTNTSASTPLERLRIDSSGNLLVGTTDTSPWNNTSGTGILASSGGVLAATSSGDAAFYGNRLGSDGDIIQLRKSGTTVGSIGVDSGDNLYLTGESGNTGGIYMNDAAVSPAYQGAERDNYYDLGKSPARWQDVYATNGTIQTSDQNEKQQIAALTDAEITAAKSISGLFKTFKWNSAVETKGDAARTHTGVIAQDVQQAMTDAGLDAGDYAFFISSTWWETQTEVPAVEAVDAVLDGDGNVVTEAVEAKDAYTRTDTYETAEEAPEGATERTRLGVRYPELLAFIGAATEQRLANIESRLAALESA